MAGSAVPAGVIADAVAAARAYLRMADVSEAGSGEAGVLERLAAAAIEVGEAFCGTRLVRRGFEDLIGAGSGWQRLRGAPVSAIQGMTGLPADGAPFAFAVDAYAIDIDAEGIGWVRVIRPGAAGRAAVSYTAGAAATWDAVPAPIAQGVAMLVAHLLANRGGDAVPPAAVAALWRPFRRIALAGAMRA